MTRLRDAAREPGFAALVLLPAAVFYRTLTGETFFFRDLYLLFLFQRAKEAAALLAGGLPLWDATLHGGQPLLANVNNTALYPSVLLYLVLPATTALAAEVLVHVAIAGAAAYLLARTLGLPRLPSFVSGLVYAWAGPTLSLVNLNRHLAAAWVPVALLFWHLFLVQRRGRWFAGTAAAILLLILSGFAELLLLAVLLLAVWTAVVPAPSRRAQAAALALVLAAAGGMAAAQVLPTLSLLSRTGRGRGFVSGSALAWSVSPRRLPELVAPGLYGRVDSLNERSYQGRAIEDDGFPYLLSLSFGAGVLLLAGAGIGGAGSISPRQARTLAAFAGVAIVLSLGRHLPGVVPLVAAIPRPPLRYPMKFVCGATLPIALLAGAGLARILEGRTALRPLARVAGAAAALLATAAVLERVAPTFAAGLSRTLFLLPPDPGSEAGVARALLSAALAAAGIALAAVLAGRRRLRFAGALACAAAALPLLAGAPSLGPTTRASLFAGRPEVVARVREAVGAGMLYRAADGRSTSVVVPSDDVVWIARRNLDTLAKYTAAGFGIPVIFHIDFDGLASIDEQTVARLVQRLDWTARVPVLAAAGVTAVLADAPAVAPGLERVAVGEGLFLYWVVGARPSATLAGEDAGARVEVLATGSPECRSFRTTSGRSATLVLTTPYSEGWTARVDGTAAEVRRANVYMQGVAIPPGAHTVELSYWPPGLTGGIAVTTFSAVALVVALAVRRRAISRPAG